MPRLPRPRDDLPLPRVQPSQERSRRKIDAILDATHRLLAEQGVEAVSMVAIAAAAGLPAPTVYHYFGNRQAVFAALVQRVADRVDAGFIPHLQAGLRSGEPDVRQLLQHLYAAYRQAPGYLAVLSVLRGDPALQAVMRQSNERVASVMATLLARTTPLPPARARRIAWIVSETCDAVLHAALAASPREARALLDEAAQMIEALFRHYAGAGKPG